MRSLHLDAAPAGGFASRRSRKFAREERYASAFGAAFLAPARAVRQKFQEVVAGSTILTRAHVIVLAHYFNISREALVRRLEDLKLVKPGRWEWFADQGGITDEQERQVLGDLVWPDSAKAEANRPTTLRLSLLASEAYRQELMSEGQLTNCCASIASNCAPCSPISKWKGAMLMASPSFRIDQSQSIILDTSAAIDLDATGQAERIIEALPYRGSRLPTCSCEN